MSMLDGPAITGVREMKRDWRSNIYEGNIVIPVSLCSEKNYKIFSIMKNHYLL